MMMDIEELEQSLTMHKEDLEWIEWEIKRLQQEKLNLFARIYELEQIIDARTEMPDGFH